MEELVKKISAQTGISEEQAGIAVLGVLSTLKENLPQFMHTYLDRAAGGERLSDSLKDDASEAINKVKEKAEEIINTLKEELTKFNKK